MKSTYTAVLMTAILFCGTRAFAQKPASSPKDSTKTENSDKKDTKKKEAKIKPFEEIIIEGAVSDDGLWSVHKVDGKNYFEIPSAILEREILVVSRIAGFVKNLNFGGAGVKSRPQQVIRWQKFDDYILLRSVSYNSIADENLPIYQSVRNNNFEPVIKKFDIKGLSKDSSGYLIEIDELFTTSVDMIGATFPSQDKDFGLKGVDKNRSFITSMKAFPTNVEVRHILTYNGSEKVPDNQLTQTLSVEMNQSFIVLPDNPWPKRENDPRVGYFSINQTDYGSDEQRAFAKRHITRWRLDPKDPEAYFRGELVEPKKQIVYYIDPATPDQWKPFIKQGVDDWQKAFEAAGFKNAIAGKYAPTKEEDPDWSPEDARYSVIRYISTDIQNAQGPHVHDPRTGEILESDIMWYHNVMNLLRNWFFIQTAAINPEARAPKFKDEVMGELIRFVAAHEVGHTLGLPHNMGSSVAYPVDSLRSKSFTDTHGTAPSIMDYARFNYIAQPEDGVTNFYPGIGLYDHWAIEYGYRLLPPNTSQSDEKMTLNQWIVEKSNNPEYRYGRQRGLPLDHTAQTEDLGDDSMKASELGIKNLKRILPKLIEYTKKDATHYNDLNELYDQVVGQYRRYIGHVTANVGGVKEDFKTFDQDEPVYVHNSRDKQKRAVKFLSDQLFSTPSWLVDTKILSRKEEGGNMERILGIQQRAIAQLLSSDRLNRMLDNELLNKDQSYAMSEFTNDLNYAIFREFYAKQNVDAYRRNLQRALIGQYADLLNSKSDDVALSDIKLYARHSLESLNKAIEKSNKKSDSMTEIHRKDLINRIEEILDIEE